MFHKLSTVKKVLFFISIVSITACSANRSSTGMSNSSIEGREKLYESTKNYNSLISLYRDVLKNKEDPIVRYKLANAYYQKGDSKSSLLYLEPLLKTNSKLTEGATLLQIRNLIQVQNYNQAISSADNLIKAYPNNGEAYNLRGIAFAQLGKLNEAGTDINKARALFVNDTVAINNLAMLSILNGDYRNATELLLPQYLNGNKDQRLVHNLVFALVKSGDIDYAKDIIRKENLNTSPDDLINALKKTERTSTAVRR